MESPSSEYSPLAPSPLASLPRGHSPLAPGPAAPSASDTYSNRPDPYIKPPIHSFDIDTQGLPIRTTGQPFRRAVNTFWLFEILCWLVAAGCVVAIIILVTSWDGSPLPYWKYGITLPTVVSLLASVTTFALGIQIEECLGQLKWLRFRKSRAASDYETIDGASTPVGSALLILKLKGGPLAFVAALLTISLLAVGPFVQQVIGTAIVAVPHMEASIPVATSFLNTSQSVNTDLSMKAAVMNGLLANTNSSSLFKTAVQCPTGNCSFTEYASLAVCGRCADLRSKLSVDDMNSNYTLSNGLSLQRNPGVIGVSMTINNTQANGTLRTIAFPDRNNEKVTPLLDMFAVVGNYNYTGDMGSNQDLNLGPYAVECLLELCIQNQTATVINGTVHENAKGPPVSFNVDPDSRIVGPESGEGPTSVVYSQSQNGQNYTIGEDTMKALWFYLNELFTGSVEQFNSASPQSNWPDDLTQAMFTWLNGTQGSLDGLFSNVASSMTLNMRMRPEAQLFQGNAFHQQAIVKITLGWMWMPVGVVCLAALLLIAVAVRTKMAGIETYKTSSLATLFAMQGLQPIEQLEQIAERCHYRLGPDANGQTVLRQVR